MQVCIHVHPGARRTRVGGMFEVPGVREDTPALQVWVTQPATDGRATSASIEAVASALGVRRRDVTLVSGATSRTKRLEVPDSCADRVRSLLTT